MSDFVWIAHPEKVWDLVQIVHRDVSQRQATVATREGAEKAVPESQLIPFDMSHTAELDDLCDMNNLHEAPLLDTLAKRISKDRMYTSASNILISINPYRNIPRLFDNPMLFYTREPSEERVMEPHVYNIANRVLNSMVSASDEALRNQSVVISGESGSGIQRKMHAICLVR